MFTSLKITECVGFYTREPIEMFTFNKLNPKALAVQCYQIWGKKSRDLTTSHLI